MRKIIQDIGYSLTLSKRYGFASKSEGADFLKMVESYFDKAGRYTNIRSDKLNFYKKPENVVKCNITLERGTQFHIQTTAAFKLSLPSGASTKPISCPPRAEPGLPRMSISRRSRPWPVS